MRIVDLHFGEICFFPHDLENSAYRHGRPMAQGKEYESANRFGYFYYQEYLGPDYMIRELYVDPHAELNLQLALKKGFTHCILGMQGRAQVGIGNKAIPLLPGQFALATASTMKIGLELEPGCASSLILLSMSMMGLEPINSIAHWANIHLLDAMDALGLDPGNQMHLENIQEQLQLCTEKTGRTETSFTMQQVEGLLAARKHIKTNYKEKLLIANCARAAGMNSSYFKKMFLQLFDITAHQYILRLRISVAKKLMQAEPHADLRTIAQKAGFDSYNNLRRAFIKWEKTSISVWRKMHVVFCFLFELDYMVDLVFVQYC